MKINTTGINIKGAPILALIVFTVLYLWLSLWRLDLPGVFYDEVIQLVPTVNILNPDQSIYFHGQGLNYHLFGLSFSLMTMDYLGALKTYLFIPIYYMFEASTITTRLPGIGFGVLSLILSFLIVQRLFGRYSAIIMIAILALDPSFIIFFRYDWGPTAIQTVCQLLSLWMLLQWLKKRRVAYLAGGFFFIGLGLYNKANFILYIVPLFLVVFLFYRKKVLQYFKLKTMLVVILFFCLGAAPFFVHLYDSGGRILLPLINPFSSVSTDHLNNLEGLRVSFKLLLFTLNGLWINDFICQRAQSLSLFPFLWSGCVCLMIIYIIFLHKKLPRKPGLKLILMFFFLPILIWLSITFSPPTWGGHHYFIVYPFFHIYCAGVLGYPEGKILSSTRKIYAFSLTFIAIVILLVFNLLSIRGFYKDLEMEQVAPEWSSRINELTQWLTEKRAEIISLDWGLHNNITVLSGGKLNSQELFWGLYERGEEFFHRALLDKLNHEDTIFLLHGPKYTKDKMAEEIFFKMISKSSSPLLHRKEFCDRRGRTIYIAYFHESQNQ